MKSFYKKELPAAAILFGGIIGAGLFAVPYTAAQAGFFVALAYIFGLGLVVSWLHLAYGEIILRTASKHRLTGYVRLYLGKGAETIQLVAAVFGIFGSLLAYALIGGRFLEILLPEITLSPLAWSLIFLGVALAVVWAGVRTIARTELMFSLLLLGLIGLIWVKSLPFVQPLFLQTFNLNQIFLPYGVVFFALIGFTSLPELRELFGSRPGEAAGLRRATLLGTWAAVLAVALFTWSVVGVTGPATSPEALQGLFHKLDGLVIWWGALLGLVAVFTSFLINADALRRTLSYDFGWTESLALLAVVGVPALLLIAGFTDLVRIIDFVGAVTGGIAGIMIVLLHAKAKQQGQRRPEFSLPSAAWQRYLLILLFCLGITYQLVTNVVN